MIEKQTEVTFEIDATVDERTLTLQVSSVPLRNALEALAQATSTRIAPLGDDRFQVRQIRMAGVAGVTNPILLEDSKVQPNYPQRMTVDRVEGTVVLQVIIDADGAVHRIDVLRNSQPGYPELVRSAKHAVQQWRYKPALWNGQPVDVYFTVVVDFRLE